MVGGGACWLVEITETMFGVCCAESAESFDVCHLSREEADFKVNNITLLKKSKRQTRERWVLHYIPTSFRAKK